MVLIRNKKASRENGQIARGNANGHLYTLTFYDKPIEVSDDIAKYLVKGSPVYEIVDENRNWYTKKDLEEKSMKELREIGKPLGAKDTSKSELIVEILSAQKKKSTSFSGEI